MANLVSLGLIEKDIHGDVLWTWMYPSVSTDLRKAIQQNCCLTWDVPSSTAVPFVYTQINKQWIHLRTELTDKLPTVTHVCLVLIASDFNVALYSSLTQILLSRYLASSSPVTMLELFLQAVTKGRCISEDNGTINIQDYDVTRYALAESKVKRIVGMFGIEFIIVFTALLLKKRIVVYHTDVAELAEVCRTLPVFIWHRLSWNAVYPLCHLSAATLDDLGQAAGGYVAGFTDAAIETRSDLYDVFVNVRSQEITVAVNAKESFAMGKLHKEIAKFIVQTTQDDSKSDADCIKEIAGRTNELLKNLRSLGIDSGDGRVIITAETLREKRLQPATENFLLGLASAEGLLQF